MWGRRLSNRTRKRLAAIYEAHIIKAEDRRAGYELEHPLGRVLPPAMHERLRVLRYKYPLGVGCHLERKRYLEDIEVARWSSRYYGDSLIKPPVEEFKVPIRSSRYMRPGTAMVCNLDSVGGIGPLFAIIDEIGSLTKDQWDRLIKKPDPMEVD